MKALHEDAHRRGPDEGGALFSMRPGRAAWKTLLPWLGVMLFLGVFFFTPLVRILWVGLNPAALFGISSDSFLVIRDASLFTFYESILSTVLTLALGLPAAFLFARYIFFGKRFLRTLTAIPFMLPTVVVAAGFTALLGPAWLDEFCPDASIWVGNRPDRFYRNIGSHPSGAHFL